MKRFTFRKVTGGDFSRCFFCRKFNTHFSLKDSRDESEVFCCRNCFQKILKKKKKSKTPKKEKSSILESKSLINSKRFSIGEVTLC